jgi:hypothetical protein
VAAATEEMRTGQRQHWRRDWPSCGEEMKNDERSRVRVAETQTEKITSEHERPSGTKRMSVNPGTPCAWATCGKWKAVHADLVASWSESKKNRSETKTLLQGEKRVLDKQNEDYRRDSVLSQLTSSKTKTAAAEKWHGKITLREQKNDWQNQRQDNEPDKRTQIWRTKEKKNEQHANVRHKMIFSIEVRLQMIHRVHLPPSLIWLLESKMSSWYTIYNSRNENDNRRSVKDPHFSKVIFIGTNKRLKDYYTRKT